jgi:hypothetical protein
MKRVRIVIDRVSAESRSCVPAAVERAVMTALAQRGAATPKVGTIGAKTARAVDAAVRGGKR